MKGEGEEEDWIDVPPGPKQLPTSLSQISAEQALELFLLISRINSATPTLMDTPEDSKSSPTSNLMNQRQIVDPFSQSEKNEVNYSKAESESSEMKINEECLSEEKFKNEEIVDKSVPVVKITEEICQAKMNELKRLLSSAHDTLTSHVNSKENLSHSSGTIDECCDEIWETPNCSRGNSEVSDRAGKYHKKPAPKAPSSSSSPILNSASGGDFESTSDQAIKTTLAIKTGTVEMFKNNDAKPSVSVTYTPELSVKKRRKMKEGISRILAIPKNMFQNAFHRENKENDRDSRSGSESFDSTEDSQNGNETVDNGESGSFSGRVGRMNFLVSLKKKKIKQKQCVY